ncbi:MAG: Holliday junction resolvase RuvX [Clostridia bacterium]|nr:Holliday junction resolvase RuvX [Clostridia bacterium]
MVILGIDFGDARVGIASSDENEILASARETLYVSGVNDAAKKTAEAFRKYGAGKMVCGLPYNMNGSESFRAEKTRVFAEKVSALTEAEIVFQDERLTTVEAYTYMNAGNMKSSKRRGVVDAMSAQILLQAYLDARQNRADSDPESPVTEEL